RTRRVESLGRAADQTAENREQRVGGGDLGVVDDVSASSDIGKLLDAQGRRGRRRNVRRSDDVVRNDQNVVVRIDFIQLVLTAEFQGMLAENPAEVVRRRIELVVASL